MYNTIQVAKLIVTYIFKHNVSVPLRRVHKGRNDHITFRTCKLISLLEVEDELQALPVSIIIIPKVKCPAHVFEYRPIILCNVLYKIFFESLSKQVKKVSAICHYRTPINFCKKPSYN